MFNMIKKIIYLVFLMMLFNCKNNNQKTELPQKDSVTSGIVYFMGGDIESNDKHGLYVNAFIPENMIGQIKIGAKVVIKVDGFEGKLFNGLISNINPEIDVKSKTSIVEVEFLEKVSGLKTGMLVIIGHDRNSVN